MPACIFRTRRLPGWIMSFQTPLIWKNEKKKSAPFLSPMDIWTTSAAFPWFFLASAIRPFIPAKLSVLIDAKTASGISAFARPWKKILWKKAKLSLAEKSSSVFRRHAHYSGFQWESLSKRNTDGSLLRRLQTGPSGWNCNAPQKEKEYSIFDKAKVLLLLTDSTKYWKRGLFLCRR